VHAHVQPEPADEEREAILRALARLGADGSAAGRSAWWWQGLREAIGTEADEPGRGLAASPTSS
jgi:hypothetical protein